MIGLDFLFERCTAVARKKVAVVCPYEDDALLSIDEARKKGFVSGVLVGEVEKISSMAKNVGVSLGDFEIIEANDEPSAAEAAVKAVSGGHADLLMKGLIKTATLLKAVLNKDWGLRQGGENSLLSHIMFAELPHINRRVIASTDGGMNMYPDLKTKVELIKNSVACFHKLGVMRPKVALVAGDGYSEDGSISQAKLDAAMLCKMKISGCEIDGPMNLDEAMSFEADLIVVPSIEAGNMFGKAQIYMGNATCAGVLLGARKPVIMLSRHDTMRSKLCSIALGAAISA